MPRSIQSEKEALLRSGSQNGFTLADREELLRRGAQGGFTLIELLIVIVILAILAAIVVFAVGSTTKNAVAASCSSDAKSVETALSAYDAQLGSYPSTLTALTTSSGVGTGPWLRSLPATTHYTMWTDANGHLFIGNASVALIATATAGSGANAISGIASVGGTVDFDANSTLCKAFS